MSGREPEFLSKSKKIWRLSPLDGALRFGVQAESLLSSPETRHVFPVLVAKRLCWPQRRDPTDESLEIMPATDDGAAGRSPAIELRRAGDDLVLPAGGRAGR